MEQKSLSKWLKVIILGMGICGMVVFAYLIPVLGKDILTETVGMEAYYYWMAFLWIAGIPCYGVLVLGWQIAGNIGADNSFSISTANKLKYISILAAADSGFFFAMNMLYLALGMNGPQGVLVSLLAVFAGVVVAVAAATISHFVRKAADLQEENELTI